MKLYIQYFKTFQIYTCIFFTLFQKDRGPAEQYFRIVVVICPNYLQYVQLTAYCSFLSINQLGSFNLENSTAVRMVRQSGAVHFRRPIPQRRRHERWRLLLWQGILQSTYVWTKHISPLCVYHRFSVQIFMKRVPSISPSPLQKER